MREEEAAVSSNYLRFSSLVVGGLGRKGKKRGLECMTLDLLCRCRQTECTDSSMVLLLASNKSKVLFLKPKKKRRLSRKQTEKGYKTEQARLFCSFQLLTYIHTSEHDHIQEKTLNHHSSHIPGFLSKPHSLAAAPSACGGDTWVFFKSYRASRQLFFYHSPIPKCQKILLLVARRRRRRSSKSLKTQRSPKP